MPGITLGNLRSVIVHIADFFLNNMQTLQQEPLPVLTYLSVTLWNVKPHLVNRVLPGLHFSDHQLEDIYQLLSLMVWCSQCQAQSRYNWYLKG